MMPRTARTVLAAGLMALVCASPAAAQTVSIDIRSGGVTLIAREVTLQRILEEWSRAGNVDLTVRGDGFSKAPVTLLLRDLTERQALDILLREVGGYLLVARQDPATGSSAFERIVILPARGETTLSRGGASPARAPRMRTPVLARDGDRIDVADTTESLDDTRAALGIASTPDVSNGPGSEREAATAQPAGGGGAGAEAPTEPGPIPPTPLLPPTPSTPSGNPFGSTGASRPGILTPSGDPPPGVVYPPVTNPNLRPQPFTPGGTPATTTP